MKMFKVENVKKKEIVKEEMSKMEAGQSVASYTKGEKRLLRTAACLALLLVFTQLPSMQVLASGDYAAVTAPFDTLKGLVAAILSSIGYIITLWGIGEWGIAYQGAEGTMQAQAFKRIGGGFVMVLAPQILAILI